MKRICLSIALLIVLTRCLGLAQQSKLPANYPPGLYDEAKVPTYVLPDPLVLSNGERVKDVKTWVERRRPGILRLFETNVYGRATVGRPEKMTWEVQSEYRIANDSRSIVKKERIFFTGTKDGPNMDLNVVLSSRTGKPVPIFLVPGFVRDPMLILERGYGLVNFNPWEIEPDRKDRAYSLGIRKVFAKSGQKEPAPDAWGTIGAWARGLSRAMDYVETDSDIDPQKVCIMGVSRYGKVVMWAGAQDEHFAIVFSCESGCGGAQ